MRNYNFQQFDFGCWWSSVFIFLCKAMGYLNRECCFDESDYVCSSPVDWWPVPRLVPQCPWLLCFWLGWDGPWLTPAAFQPPGVRQASLIPCCELVFLRDSHVSRLSEVLPLNSGSLPGK